MTTLNPALVLTSPLDISPFSLNLPARPGDGPVRRWTRSAVSTVLEKTLGLAALNRVYRNSRLATDNLADFYEETLRNLRCRLDVLDDQLARIPKTGPLVVVANHPYGGVEGVILPSILHRVRQDVRGMANFMLSRVPELRETYFFVDPFGGEGAAGRSSAGIRQSIRHLKNGGVLIIFPAGEVSSLHPFKRCVTDPAWSDAVSRIIRKTEAAVLPVFFDGRNSAVFQLAGLIHPRLRTALLAREMVKPKNPVRVRIGAPIKPERLKRFDSDADLTAYLRMRTYLLRGQLLNDAAPPNASPFDGAPIIDPIEPAVMTAEINALPAERTLATSGDLSVLWATADEIPQTLREIGRLREITFRAAGEGTGNPLDLDRFDKHYLHLVMWDRVDQQVAGGYRMTKVDQTLEKFGAAGLYTSTLFRFQNSVLLEQLAPGIECGRSFIRAEYQKDFAPLSLLWKGLGHYAARNPRYKLLFGPVSISNRYKSVSRQLLADFLNANTHLPDVAGRVKPKNPLKHRRRTLPGELRQAGFVVRSADEVNELISEIESDRKSMPVLLRQYLKLNAMLLGLNVDPDFGDVLDGLMLVDLTKVDKRTLDRYLGKEGNASFRAHHGIPDGEPK